MPRLRVYYKFIKVELDFAVSAQPNLRLVKVKFRDVNLDLHIVLIDAGLESGKMLDLRVEGLRHTEVTAHGVCLLLYCLLPLML